MQTEINETKSLLTKQFPTPCLMSSKIGELVVLVTSVTGIFMSGTVLSTTFNEFKVGEILKNCDVRNFEMFTAEITLRND